MRKISAMVDSKDEELVSFMSCLQLDYIKAHLDPVILPQVNFIICFFENKLYASETDVHN